MYCYVHCYNHRYSTKRLCRYFRTSIWCRCKCYILLYMPFIQCMKSHFWLFCVLHWFSKPLIAETIVMCCLDFNVLLRISGTLCRVMCLNYVLKSFYRIMFQTSYCCHHEQVVCYGAHFWFLCVFGKRCSRDHSSCSVC